MFWTGQRPPHAFLSGNDTPGAAEAERRELEALTAACRLPVVPLTLHSVSLPAQRALSALEALHLVMCRLRKSAWREVAPHHP